MNTQLDDSEDILTDADILHIDLAVRARIRLASEYDTLLSAAMRFVASLYGKASGEYAQAERKYMAEPETLLSAHARVMNARSARCQTLRALANTVIAQAGLQSFMHKPGMYRGMEYRVDYMRVPKSWRTGE